MRWFEVVAQICEWFGRRWTILDREERYPYLIRYYLFSTRFLDRICPRLSYRVVLHHTIQSDDPREGLHDHPWSWKSKLVSGGYWEHTPSGRIWRDSTQPWRSGAATDLHRLELDPDHAESLGLSRDTWSLFVMGPREREWGFMDHNGVWVHWHEYIRNRNRYMIPTNSH